MIENLFNLGYNMSRLGKTFRKLKKYNTKGVSLENEPLASKVTYKTGGNARIYLEVCTIENFLHIMEVIRADKIDYFVLGAGSNTLVSDNGYDGVVITLSGDLARIETLDESRIECGAGVRLSQAYMFACNLELSGLEDGAGIPASIGGAVYMNAGAYNFQMSDIVEYVVAYVDGKITYFKKEECGFDYRESWFQHNDAIILRVGLNLKKSSRDIIDSRFKEVLSQRLQSQPLDKPSAGCVFRNQEGVVVSRLLDECGLKGTKFGGAEVSKKHANFVINAGGATSQDILELIEVMRHRVLTKTNIDLKTEIVKLGEFDEITW